ncbi:RNA polymerase III RPC4 domain-containing protein [Trichoderma sp. SZMC 28012]
MVRGRATGRGVGRGSAAASSRSQTEGADDSNQLSSNAAPTANMGLGESSTDQAASSQSAASTARRGATSARAARGAASTGRFRPKNVRRDESERDALAQQEQQKASDRAADERRARGRSRFRSKRSRGDAMGSRGGGFGRPVGGASGPFSSGMGGPGGTAGGGWFGAGGGGGGGGGFARTGKFEGKPGSGFGFASEGGFRETRINADKLHTMAHDEDLDSEDEAMLAALHSRPGGVMPMGILRREHKEAPVVVATTAELEAAEKALDEEESLWVDGEAPGSLPPADQPEEGDWNTSAKRAAKVKKEPTDDTMDLDVDIKPADEGKLPLSKIKAKKPIAQDPEENMIRTDLSLLASELGAITINGDGEEKADETGNKDGRLYLFQFPPLLPPLKQVAAPQPRIKVKEEEQHSASLHATPLSVSSTATPVDLTQQGEEEEEESDEEDEEQERRNGFRSQALSNGGLIGRLNVRKSGKVELDWGGRILEMSPAAGMNFLTTAVIVEESDEKPQNGVTTGESIGMGKIMGRFVLAPIWNEEEEWEVAPEELDIGAMNQ